MELFEAIYTRRAIRQFADGDLDRNMVLTLIDAAVQAPSVLDQPWAFFVIQERTVLAKLSADSKTHLLTMTPSGGVPASHRKNLEDPRFDLFYGAPVVIIVCAHKGDGSSLVTAAEECCLAAENLVLAAHAKGVGSCWVGLARPWLNTRKAKRELGIAEAWMPVAPIALGWPAHLPPPPPRRVPLIAWYGAKR